MSQANTLKAVWASFPGAAIRHKIFVHDHIDIRGYGAACIAARTAAETLYYRGTLPSERFPVKIELFTGPEETAPVHTVSVGMDVRAVFFETGEARE